MVSSAASIVGSATTDVARAVARKKCLRRVQQQFPAAVADNPILSSIYSRRFIVTLSSNVTDSKVVSVCL